MGYFSNLVIDKTEFMTFDNFSVTPENEPQVYLAQRLADNPQEFRCMFFHLPADQRLHLKNAIANQWGKDDRNFMDISVTDFMEELIGAIRNGEDCSYVRYYMDCDIMLVDDLQLMANRENTQEVFYAHVLKPRIEAGLVTVMFSECSHKELARAFREDLHNLLRLGMHNEK
jgi:chromosomal replication initiator protein